MNAAPRLWIHALLIGESGHSKGVRPVLHTVSTRDGAMALPRVAAQLCCDTRGLEAGKRRRRGHPKCVIRTTNTSPCTLCLRRLASVGGRTGPGTRRGKAQSSRLRGKEGESLQAGWSVDGRWERSSGGSAQDMGRVIVPIASSAPATAPSARFSPFACLLRIQLKLRCITPP